MLKRAMVSIVIAAIGCTLTIAVGAKDEPILVINPHGHSSQISKLLFTPDGQTLISVSYDKTIRLWDVANGDLRQTLRHQIGPGREGEIHAAALSPDGRLLAVGGIAAYDEAAGIPVYVFDLAHGDIISVLPGHPDLISALAFSPDGRWLASSSVTSVRLWDVADFSASPPLLLQSESEVFDLAFAPDGERLVSAHVDGRLRLWDVAKHLKHAPQAVEQPNKVLKSHQSVACCVAYSPDGKYIVSGDFDGHYCLWNAKKGKLKKKFKPMGTAASVAFAPDSKHVLISNGNKAEVYTVPKLKKVLTFAEHASEVQNNAFSNMVTAAAFYGNDLIATAGGNQYDIYVWDARSGEVQTHISGQGNRVEAVGFGEGLTVAFGNTSGGLRDFGPLERAFDFAEMQLLRRLPADAQFTRAQTDYHGQTLRYTFGDWYDLEVKAGPTITNSPSDGWVRAYTFTPAGDIVIGSSHVLRRHRADGTAAREYIGHTGEVWAVAVSQDGRILASASDDQTVKLWNLATGECLATLFVGRDSEWVCWTPQGYYAASAGGERYIGWRLNRGREQAAQYYPVSVFRKRFHQPDLVKRTIGLGSFAQARQAFDLETTQVTQVLPPQVQWIAPQETTTTMGQPSVRIQAAIQSDSPLRAVKILVNGRSRAAERGLAMGGQPREPQMQVDEAVTLTPGRNDIVIFAANADAGASSEARTVFYNTDALKPDLYMVSIGISDYDRQELQLTYADDDARAVSQVFRAQTGRLYRQVTIRELYDQEATRPRIQEALEWLGAQATPNDVAVVFIAAHGQNEHGAYYLLPADGDPFALPDTGVSWQDFSEQLGNLPARVLLLLDTCHSGQLGRDVYTLRQQVDNTEAIRELSSEEYGVVILAASTGREFSLEHPEWGHGAFTKALVEALDEGQADYSEDGWIHLREMDLYVADRVEALTRGEQHPTTQKPSTISRFPIVQLP